MNIKQKRILVLLLTLAFVSVLLVGCNQSNEVKESTAAEKQEKEEESPTNETESAEPVTISYLTWESNEQQVTAEEIIAGFMEKYPHITVEAQFVPYSEYHSKINTLIAADTAPDVYQINEYLAVDWGEKGVAADLNPLFMADGIVMEEKFIPAALFKNAEGEAYGLSIGVVNQMLYFNKEMFDDAGLDYPPMDPLNAWTWDQFVTAAKSLTTDASGLHPDDEGFDVASTMTFGTKNITKWLFMLPILQNNDAGMFSADGMSTGLDTPQAKEVLQSLYDLMYVDKVAPVGATAEALPGNSQLFKNKQLGMFVGGLWEYSNFVKEGIDVGLAALPAFARSTTIAWSACLQISAASENLDEAYKLLSYRVDPNNDTTVRKNCPNEKSWYEGEKFAKWTSDDMYSDDFRTIIPMLMSEDVALVPENVTVKGFGPLMDEVYTPTLDKLWLDEATVDEVVEEIIAKSEGMYQGKWN